jgi:hypothetical protein
VGIKRISGCVCNLDLPPGDKIVSFKMKVFLFSAPKCPQSRALKRRRSGTPPRSFDATPNAEWCSSWAGRTKRGKGLKSINLVQFWLENPDCLMIDWNRWWCGGPKLWPVDLLPGCKCGFLFLLCQIITSSVCKCAKHEKSQVRNI